ncbi:MAG: 50S ribosomal protein L11 methyltransferase [Pirellulales bacterium]
MRHPFTPALLAVAAASILSAVACDRTRQTPAHAGPNPDVGFVPSPQVVVDKMLELAEVTPKDVVYDLGCGNGIIVVSAARKGARAVGFDIDPERIRETQDNIDRNKVGDRAKVVRHDIFTLDLAGADVITLYLLMTLNERLIPQLEQLKPGSRIVSHNFAMRGIKPEKMVTLQTPTGEHRVYLWRTPLEKDETYVKEPDVVFVPTPQVVVDKMLELAEVAPKDVVYDLGCGNGIIVVSAARKGARAVGFDIDPERIRETQDNIEKNKVGDLAKVVEQDIFTLDLTGASVITLYLLPSLNVKLIPQLEKLKPGSRIVSHNFAMRGIKPEKTVTVKGPSREHTVYLWRTPLEKEVPSE